MLELFTKLVEKLIELVRERQRIKKSLHDDFIVPLMKQFDEVHNQYISSFQIYREQVQKQSPSFDSNNNVFKQLETDMIFSHSSREKLFAMSESMTPFYENYNSSNEDAVGKLIMDMFEYIRNIADAAGNRYRNAPRGTLLSELRHIASGYIPHEGMTPSQAAEREIMEKMWEMQDYYARIQRAYHKAKADLLK